MKSFNKGYALPILGAEGIFNEDCTSSIRYHDIYTPYEIGVCRLLKRMGPTHARYSDGLVFQQRLKENIQAARRYGDVRGAERAEILDRLNGLSLAVLGVSFNELCEFEFAESQEHEDAIQRISIQESQVKNVGQDSSRLGRQEIIIRHTQAGNITQKQ